MILALLFILLFVIVWLTYLPPLNNASNTREEKSYAWRYKHLKLGVLAIFMYVGGEVTIGSFLIGYQEEALHYPESLAKSFLAFYWGGAMIGRFLGAISLKENKNEIQKWIQMILTAFILFIFLYFSSTLGSSHDLIFIDFLPFIAFIIVNLLGFRLGKYLPHRTLFFFALMAVILLLSGLFLDGKFSLWCFIGVGLFNSIMFPTIFTLAIKDLHQHTSQASSLLVMAILGGAIIPPIQGIAADYFNVHISFFVPIVCYLYIAFYGWKGYQSFAVVQIVKNTKIK